MNGDQGCEPELDAVGWPAKISGSVAVLKVLFSDLGSDEGTVEGGAVNPGL